MKKNGVIIVSFVFIVLIVFTSSVLGAFTVIDTLTFGGKATVTGQSAPTQSGEVPANGSSGISRWPSCNVTCSDIDENDLTVYFYENTTGDWVLQQTNGSHPANTSAVWSNYSNASSYGTMYWWSVNLTDGTDWCNETYHFTTESEPIITWTTLTFGGKTTITGISLEPTQSNESPTNGSTGVSLNPTLQITVNDPDGDTMNQTFRTNASGTWTSIAYNNNTGNATVSNSTTVFSSYTTKYWWSSNLSDGTYWTNNTYYFTTMEESILEWTTLSFGAKAEVTDSSLVLSNEQPSNESTNVDMYILLNITVNSPQGKEFNITWLTNESGSWTEFAYNSSLTNGTYRQRAIWANSSDTIYWWQVNVNDTSQDWTNETYCFQTTTYTWSGWSDWWSFDFTSSAWSNTKPSFSNPVPTNDSTEQSLQPIVNVTITDADGNSSTCNFYTSTDGSSWIWRQQNTTVLNESIEYNYVQASSLSTLYYWKVTANDTHDNASVIYHFTTQSVPYIGDPVVTTGSPTGIMETNVTLHGTLSNDGGASCTMWFEYGTTAGYGNDTRYNLSYNFINSTTSTDTSKRPELQFNSDYWIKNNTIGADTDIGIFLNASGLWDNVSAVFRLNGALLGWSKSIDPIYNTLNDITSVGRYRFVITNDTVPFLLNWDSDITRNTGYNHIRDFYTYPGTLYHYRACANNSVNTTYGSNSVFLSRPKSIIRFPGGPNPWIHINGTYSPSVLNLTWIKGLGANNTYIERNTASSWSRGSGTLVYNDTGTYYNDTGLIMDTLYYYQAWGYANWTDDGITYNQYSSDYASNSNTTASIDPPYNGDSVYDITNLKLNLTWTSGNNSDYDIVIQNNNSYPSSPTDGWIRQNSSANSSNYFNESIDYSTYFTVWSYNLTGNIYSSTGLNIPWGALGMQCYDEATGLPLMYDVLITNSDLDTLNLVNIGNIYYLDMTTIPYGTNTVFYVSSDGYESRTYYYDMELNNFYNLTFYLPLAIPSGEGGDPGGGGEGGQDCVTRMYTDSVTITNPAVDAVITLTHVLDEMIDVHIYNDELYGTYGGWVPVPTDKFSFTSSTVTIDKSVLFANSTIGRVQYYYEDCGDYDPSNHTYSHLYRFIVINEIDQTLEGVKLQVLRYLNFTEDWEEVSILLTDANGQADVYLLAGSGLFYKIKASKTDYTTQTIDFIPDTNYYGVYYPKTIRLIREEIEIPDIVTGFDFITWDAYFISGDNTTLYIDYVDDTGNTTIGNIKVYRNGTYLNYTYNFTVSSFSITFDYANHSLYDYKVMLNITGHPDITSGNFSDIRIIERYHTPDESMFDFSWALEIDFVEVLGDNPLGWVNLIVLFLGLVIMLSVGKAWAGIGIIGLGAILFIVQRVIGLPGFTLVQLAVIPFLILFGLLTIIAKNKKDVRF